MSLTQGRKGFIGLGKETTPGDPVTPTVDIPFTEQSLNAKHEPIGDVAAKGIRDGEYGSVSGKKWGEGNFKVTVDETNIGYLLDMIFGTVSAPAAVSGDINDHTFSRNNSNTPQTYSVILDRQIDKKLFPYAVANSMELSFSDGLVTLSADIMSKFPVTSVSGTLTVVSGHLYAWKDALVKFGSNLTAAGNAQETQVSEFTLNIENNATPTWRSGSQEPATINVGTFRVYGSYKLFFESTSHLDKFRNKDYQAMIIELQGRELTTGYNEFLKFNIPKFRINESLVDTPLDDYNTITVTFEAEYDSTTSKMIDSVLRNEVASYV